MIATGGFYHIQPSSYRPASAPISHTVMLPVGSINLFIGFTHAFNPADPPPPRVIPLAGPYLYDEPYPSVDQIYVDAHPILDRVYTATAPISEDGSTRSSDLEDDTDSADPALVARPRSSSAPVDSSESPANPIAVSRWPPSPIDGSETHPALINGSGPSAVLILGLIAVGMPSTDESIALVSNPSDYDDSIYSLFEDDFDADFDGPSWPKVHGVFMAVNEDNPCKIPSPCRSQQRRQRRR
jgi:hypothetical protein